MSTTTPLYTRLFSGPLMLLSESRDPTLAFWGRVAQPVAPVVLFGSPAILGLIARQPSGSFLYNFVGIAYLILLSMVGLIAFRTGRILARMSDEHRVEVLSEVIVAKRHLARAYWQRRAIFGALFVPAMIIFIVLIVAGVI